MKKTGYLSALALTAALHGCSNDNQPQQTEAPNCAQSKTPTLSQEEFNDFMGNLPSLPPGYQKIKPTPENLEIKPETSEIPNMEESLEYGKLPKGIPSDDFSFPPNDPIEEAQIYKKFLSGELIPEEFRDIFMGAQFSEATRFTIGEERVLSAFQITNLNCAKIPFIAPNTLPQDLPINAGAMVQELKEKGSTSTRLTKSMIGDFLLANARKEAENFATPQNGSLMQNYDPEAEVERALDVMPEFDISINLQCRDMKL